MGGSLFGFARALVLVVALPLLALVVSVPAAGGGSAHPPGWCVQHADFEDQFACSTASTSALLLKAAPVALVLGLLLIAGITLVGALARLNRPLLIALFVPGLYVTNVAVVALVLLSGFLALGIGVIVCGALLSSGGLPAIVPLAALGSGIAALLSAIGMLQACFSMVHRARAHVSGVALPEGEYPSLWQAVRELAAGLQAQAPEHIVAGFDPGFFVTEARVHCLDAELKGRTLYLSLPMCRVLSRDELKAILGHELGHFRGWDTRYSHLFTPVYRGTLDSIGAVGQHAGGWQGFAALPAFYVLVYFFERFAAAESSLSRRRELAADQLSAQVVGSRTAATALVKAHGLPRYWRRALALLREAIAHAQKDVNASALFEHAARENIGSAFLRKDLDEEEPPHPTDTHPPLSERLRSIGTDLSEVMEEAMVLPKEDAAISLVDGYERLELQLTEIERQRMIESRMVWEGSARH